MLAGQWSGGGCEYCRDIERAGGESERTLMNSDHQLTPKNLQKIKKQQN